MTKLAGTTRFDRSDLDLFSAASHDRNPLHLSETYARRTPYGEPVVYGVLGGLAALAHTAERSLLAVSGISMTFRHPLFTGVDYRIEVDAAPSEADRVRIFDGQRLLMTVATSLGGSAAHRAMPLASVKPVLSEPVDRRLEDLRAGLEVSGSYAPSLPDLERLIDRWRLFHKGMSSDAWAALLWVSYLVGMELPGRRALFWSADVQIHARDSGSPAPYAYRARIVRPNVELEYVDIEAELSAVDGLVATAKLRAFVRAESPTSDASLLEALLPQSARLRGKLAIVIGGSRGLGSAIVQALASQGCSVLASYRESVADAERVRTSVRQFVGAVDMIQGDAADEGWCRDTLHPLMATRGGVDILVCNASPPIRTLNLSLDEIQRFRSFVAESLDLVSVPMAALMESLNDRSACCVLISSSFVRSIPVDWPHYIAAKSAAEGLVSWAAAKYKAVRFIVARPPRLLTDQVNTQAGRQGALPVERAAAAIVQKICDPPGPERIEILERF